jgi:hippurate hydrolase
MSANALLATLRTQAAPFVALRRDIHRHPELGLQEHRTSALVAERLREWGYSVHTGLAGTGLVAQLRRGDGPRRLGLRADMDALPIHEANTFAHASAHPGVMHACGHDGHTATLMAAAHHIAHNVAFSGTLNLIFQPAEEGPGGARLMLEDGLFERFPCDAVFALHNMPGFPVGHAVLREGAFMASSDNLTITLRGVGGHGALPHHATDVVVAAAAIVMALQTVVSRNVDPQQTAVVTVGALQAGEANNVIPAQAELRLSVRALDRGVRGLLEQRIRALVVAQAESLGVSADIDWRPGYPVLVNTPAETALAREVACELLGPGNVTPQGPAFTGSEDFAFLLERCPGCYLLLGNGEGSAQGACMVHNPGYDFNDDILPVGAAFWSLLVQRFLVP